MWTSQFWKEALERAVKTFCQTLAAAIGTQASFTTIKWPEALSMAGAATVLSILTSIVSAPASPQGSPSLVSVPCDPAPPKSDADKARENALKAGRAPIPPAPPVDGTGD